ncbi:hypothetical protein [Cloacibacillus porcorum]
MKKRTPWDVWKENLEADADLFIRELPEPVDKEKPCNARFPKWALELGTDSAAGKIVFAIIHAPTVGAQIRAVVNYIAATRGYLYSVTLGQIGSSKLAKDFLRAVRRVAEGWPVVDMLFREHILRELDELAIFVDEFASEQYEIWQEAQCAKRRKCMSDDMDDGTGAGEKAENDHRPSKPPRAILPNAGMER